MNYNYWTIRYVPNVIRGEFVNIGLLVGRDGEDWAFREVSSLRRANRLGGDPTIARYWLSELRSMCRRSTPQPTVAASGLWTPDTQGQDVMSEGTLHRLQGRLNNAVQIAPARTVISDSAEDGLDMLFDHLVADPASTTRTQFRSRISKVIEESFLRQLSDSSSTFVERRPVVHVGKSARTADIALTDNRVEQITKAWSFNLADAEKVQTEIEAWAYLMAKIQEKGGILTTAAGQSLLVPDHVQFRVIYEEPSTAARAENLQAATEIWSQVDGLKTYSSSQANELVRDGLALVA
ncbi:DUF3037 domain-containing protein [Pseudarthrobacter sp. HLT3-5]|uniref:DUF3037 domain-containing protein n=1 Tax=Pseudarthrobacter cellobiosi TaxID=2953654 RepID=UPI00208E9BFC|nr:DUF3037 domain-containing protein [Pseudarthrobacter sp. HLT3-5]MCO4276097.1 DUF3037 domain-containing protein [Pseudarthrobacter sp. HLT3-5]